MKLKYDRIYTHVSNTKKYNQSNQKRGDFLLKKKILGFFSSLFYFYCTLFNNQFLYIEDIWTKRSSCFQFSIRNLRKVQEVSDSYNIPSSNREYNLMLQQRSTLVVLQGQADTLKSVYYHIFPLKLLELNLYFKMKDLKCGTFREVRERKG